jgi:hypothetical protein
VHPAGRPQHNLQVEGVCCGCRSTPQLEWWMSKRHKQHECVRAKEVRLLHLFPCFEGNVGSSCGLQAPVLSLGLCSERPGGSHAIVALCFEGGMSVCECASRRVHRLARLEIIRQVK